MFIIDFDDTLFNTSLLKQQRERALLMIGISKQIYDHTYKIARVDSNGLYSYTNERHAQILSECGFDYDQVLHAFSTVMTKKNLENLLFDDSKNFLEYLKSKNNKLILLSLGSKKFQQLKSSGSGILDYFDEVFFVQKNKEDVVLSILKKLKKQDYKQNIYFINDKIKESQDIENKFKELKVIIKNNNNFKNFSEIKDYIENYE